MFPILSFIRRVDGIPILIAAIALFLLMTMTFCDVVLRSTFNAPIEAATELTRIFVAIMVFAVLPHVSVSNQHISVDLTDGLFDRFNLARWRDGLMHIICAVLMIWPTVRVAALAERTRGYGDVTEYLAIPQFYMMWFIAVFTALSAVAMFVVGMLRLFAPHLLRGDTA